MNNKSFLGIGWSFPPTFDDITRQLITVSDEEDIHQSLQILLSTQLTERIMLPDYGCDLSAMQFENITTTLLTKIKGIIEDAILIYEPRIETEQISFYKSDPAQGIIHIEIIYLIRNINSRKNIVFPYYIKEGTFIQK